MSSSRPPLPTPLPLEPSGDELRTLIDEATARIVEHLERLPEQPVSDTRGGDELALELAEPLPVAPTPAGEALDLLFGRAVEATYNTASPGYLGFIPGGGIPTAAVADLVSGALNRYTGVWLAAPAFGRLEANVLGWLAEIIGYPPTARGWLTSGGSLANWAALVTARRERLPEDFLDGTIYVSGEVHHAVTKGAVLAGFPPHAVRRVAVDDRLRIRPDALDEAVARDRAKGRRPFLVVASGGTVNTGTVDPLEDLADVARDEGLWLHVDGAYGGFFCLTDRGRRTLAGIERADSVVLDPHKSLFLPYGTGALLVRDGQALRRAHDFSGDYMPASQDDPERPDVHTHSPELSRPFRGLRLWLPIKLHGIDAFRRALDEKLDLARWLAERVAAIDAVEIVAPPELSLFAFRLALPGLPPGEADALNRRLLERVNRRQRVFLTGTTAGGSFVLRVCVLSFRTHRDRIEAALEDIRSAVAETLPEAAEHAPRGV